MKKFKHFILTRFNTMHMIDHMLYDDKKKADKWMEGRMYLFTKTKESVLSQDADFEWIISVDKRTPKKFIDKIKGDKITIVHGDIRDVFLSGEVVSDAEWTITTRFDNDDLYTEGAIKKIQEHFEPKLKVIDALFEKLDTDTGKHHRIAYKSWNWQNSPFISLIEPSDRVLTAFCRPHGQVATGYPSGKLTGTYPAGKVLIKIDMEVIPEYLTVQVCHGGNLANKI